MLGWSCLRFSPGDGCKAEIDGVAFTYKRGARRGGGVHRTLNSLMESIQTYGIFPVALVCAFLLLLFLSHIAESVSKAANPRATI